MIGLSPVGNALIVPLEERFPPWDDRPRRAAWHRRARRRAQPRRLACAQHGGAQRGGRTPDRGGRARPALSRRAHHLLRRLRRAGVRRAAGGGIRAAAVREPRRRRRAASSPRTSRATRSRTRGSRATIAQPKPGERWLLVTSAYHLPRSVGVFRKAGFPVEAYPVDWRTRGTGDALRPFATLGDGLRRTDTAVREWVGLSAYWLTGASSELFPGPIPARRMRPRRRGLDNCRP